MSVTMDDSVGLDRIAARQLVENIALSHGYISAEMLAAMLPQVRLVVEEALRKKEDIFASSALMLARSLQTSNARFIFELLQNADDNHYTQARATGDAPYISFHVYHNMLVVECNEDGFTEEDLNAICDIGKSSRQGTQGYVGEKGIGFKSVFRVAWKVQIQSGPFSFYFQHREGDSGMGTIIPIWFEPRTESPRPRTWIALHFHDNGEAEDLQHRRDDIIKQLRDLQGTILLFSKNLRSIKIAVFNQEGQPPWSRQTTMTRDVLGSFVQLHVVERDGTASMEKSDRFYLTSHLAQELPKKENRIYSESEEKNKAYSTAQVVLAFPLDKNDVPIIEAQELFAFMPLRKFLIHSDFITQANRQDIVATAERNIKLRQAIGDAFVRGVQQFCMHPKLQYRWMRFLPRKGTLPPDPFWKDLVPYLSEALCEKHIISPRSDYPKRLYKITEVRRFNEEQLDKDGKPLFPDLLLEKYLSAAYDLADLDILGEYGLQNLQMSDVIPRMHAYIKGPDWQSKVYQDRDEDWHSRVARLMLQAWEEKSHGWNDELRSMPLLPLRSLHLKSATLENLEVFFPDIDSVPIPQDINLPMILPAAAANPDCRRLYEALGVKSADHTKVRELILEKHRLWDEQKLDVAISNNHLRYLYQMDPQDRINREEQDKIVVFDHKEQAKHPKREYVYLPGEGECSPSKLLQTPQGADFQAFDASFIHPAYLRDSLSPQTDSAYTWVEWLHKVAWIEDRVQIFNKRDNDAQHADKSKAFSEEWLFVAEHWSSKVIARFHENWLDPRVRMIWEDDEFGTGLARELEVLCTDGKRYPLQTTFLPLPSLLARCESLLINVDSIPFLNLESSLQDSDIHEWVGFGKHFGVGVADDMNLSLNMLRAITYGDSKTKGPFTQTVIELYLRIHAQCLISESREKAQEKVRSFFAENCGMLCSPLEPNLPSGGENTEPEWAFPNDCLWDAPAHLSQAVPLKVAWEPVLATLSLQDRENLERFFSYTLMIRNVNDSDILMELVHLSESREADPASSPELQFIHDMYQRLDRLRKAMDKSSLRVIKETFEQKPIIYVPSDQPQRWFKVPECIWSSEKTVLAKTCLESLYPDLTSLFVDYLGIPKLSSTIVYRELIEIGGSAPTIVHIKNLLWLLRALLPSDIATRPTFGDEAALCRIFPVRMPNGNVELLTAREEFAITDRQIYADALKNKIKILDFTMDEVRRLRPLIEWAGLTDRYLSRSVVEQTAVNYEQCVEDRHMTRDLARKAGAFVSVAAHFDSPVVSSRPEIIHSTLRDTKVFTTETITSTLIIAQDGEETNTSIGNSELHIRLLDDGGLEIYVPASDDARDVCIATRLPHELAAYLFKCKPSSVNPQVISIFSSITHAKPTSTGRILEVNGIIELDLPLRDEDDSIDDEQFINQRAMVRSGLSPPITTAAIPNRHMERRNSHSGYVLEPARSISISQESKNEEYHMLLGQIAKVARGMPFPDRTPSFDMSALLQTFQEDSASQKSYKFYAGDQTEWRLMVEAAGELFAFELLSALSPKLPKFGHPNWQSTVRHYVRTHPDYSTLEPWNGAEISDIFYSDNSGIFTTTLIEKGYLDETWKGEKPDYFIEVKTTMLNNLETPFSLSKYQYSQMKSLSGGGMHPPRPKKKIFALFRVYGLESGLIGVKVYIDPEVARKDGHLEFEADGWTVTPRRRTRMQIQSQDGGGASWGAGTLREHKVNLDFGRTVMPVFKGS